MFGLRRLQTDSIKYLRMKLNNFEFFSQSTIWPWSRCNNKCRSQVTIGTISCFCIYPTAALMCPPKSGKILHLENYSKNENETFASFAICSVFSSTSFSLFPLSHTASLAFAISDPPAAAFAWKSFSCIFPISFTLCIFLVLFLRLRLICLSALWWY